MLLVALLYDLINPGIPNLEPPKYLTIKIAAFIICLLFNTFNIGRPALPLGSPASVENSSILLLFNSL